jgi:nucleoside-diphosphate-sugar epimerase
MKPRIAIFGSNGYIGKKLTRALYNLDYQLVLFSRNKRNLEYINHSPVFNGYKPNICIVEQIISASYYKELVENLKGVDIAYYLIHSLSETKQDYRKKDNDLASIVACAAKEAGVKQIIYLGGFGERDNPNTSKHLISRQDTGDFLRKYHPNVTEIRAGIIVGAGSMSFELIRSAAEILPAIPYFKNEGKCQITFADDVIEALIKVLDNSKYYNKIIEVASDEILSYSEMVKRYAKEILNKNIKTIKLPKFLEDKLLKNFELISFILSRISGIEKHFIKPLVESLYSNALVKEKSDIIPNPTDFSTAIRLASERRNKGELECMWNTPYEYSVFNIFKMKQFSTALKNHKLLTEVVSNIIPKEKVEKVFYNLKSLSYKNCGYFSPQWMWKVRAFIDRLLGGRGLGVRMIKPERLKVGDKFDFWVVTALKDTPTHKLIRFKSTMKMPGVGWLQGEIKKTDKEYYNFSLTAYFLPTSVYSYIYWYFFFFIHKYIFDEMYKNIVGKDCKGLNCP